MQFNRNNLPKNDEYVMIKVVSHDENMGVHCELLEYKNIPAVILNGEISKYKVNYNKKFPIGKVMPCSIYMIDKQRNHINLSCKNINDELAKKIEEIYLYKCYIYRLFHEIENEDDPDYISEMIWNCFTYLEDKEDHDYNWKQYYEMMLDDPNLIFNFDKDNLLENKSNIINKINSRVKKTDITSELHFSLLFLDGFNENIKKLLILENDFKNIKLNSVSSPIYSVLITSKNLDEAKETLQIFFDKLKDNLVNLKYELEYDINNLKIIHDRQFYFHYSKMI